MPESSVQRWASCPQGTQPPSPGLCLEWALFTSSSCSLPHADIDPACWHAPWQRLQMPGRTSESQTKCSLDVSETEQGQVQCWELRSAKDAARSTLGLLSKIAFIRCFRASGVSLRSWCLRTIPAVLAQLTASAVTPTDRRRLVVGVTQPCAFSFGRWSLDWPPRLVLSDTSTLCGVQLGDDDRGEERPRRECISTAQENGQCI